MMQNERLDKQLKFLIEADKIKNVFRRTYNADQSRKENSAEHSWHLALLALILSEYSNEEIDKFKVMSMVIIHDLIEIDAGDTYVYDAEANKSKAEREQKAADRIFGILPDDQRDMIRALWEEFEERKTPEARFANVLDRFDPVILNHVGGGKAWREHEVTRTQAMEIHNTDPTPGADTSEILHTLKMQILEENIALGNILDK